MFVAGFKVHLRKAGNKGWLGGSIVFSTTCRNFSWQPPWPFYERNSCDGSSPTTTGMIVPVTDHPGVPYHGIPWATMAYHGISEVDHGISEVL